MHGIIIIQSLSNVENFFLASPDVHIILKPYQRIDIDAEQYTKVDLTRGIES